MAAYGTVTITTTATKILDDVKSRYRKSAIITNTSSTNVYLGFDSDVTTANGFLLGEQDVWDTNEPRAHTGFVYGIVGAGSIDIRFMELI